MFLSSFVHAVSDRFLILADLHAGDTADGANVEIQDGNKFRIFSNWSQRLNEACLIGVEQKVDFAILLGDNINGTDSTPQTTWEAVLNQIEAELLVPLGIKLVAIIGNHEDNSAMEISEFVDSYKSELLGANEITGDIVGGTHWPELTGNRYASFRADLTNFHIISTWGAPAPATRTIWDNTGVAYEGANVNAAAELDWLENTALSGITKPVLVFCHNHLSDTDGAATIPSSVLSGNPDTGDPNLQTILADAGQKVTVFCGHYHRVAPNTVIDWEKDTIAGVDYYNLGGSVLGCHPKDFKGNLFFIIDIDTVEGVTNLKAYKYHDKTRNRYVINGIGKTLGTSRRSRGRN